MNQLIPLYSTHNCYSNYVIAKFQITEKHLTLLLGSPLAKLHQKNKWFSYFRCILNSLTLRIVSETNKY